MRLDQELVKRGLCESREEAKECIEKGFVLVDNIVVTKKTRLIHDTSLLLVTQRRKFVSRGGDKLEGILTAVYGSEKAVRASLRGTYALDVGSSTGGFTDCLLSYGVTHVIAVDVGTAQFHKKLLDTTNITLFENTDIRNFSTEKSFDVIVADVSFIALNKILDIIISFGNSRTQYFLLIKPQFEVGFGNTKKGIVKNEELVQEVLTSYKKLLVEKNFSTIKIFPCVIQGGDGNQEYFIYAQQSTTL